MIFVYFWFYLFIFLSLDNLSFIKFTITNSRDARTWEKQYPLTITVEDLKMRFEMLSGIEINNMAIQYYADNEIIGVL